MGNGDPASCTPATLFTALDLGGPITFNCGPAPKDILFGTSRTITATTSLNGGPTLTDILAANSAAVNAGANCPAIDQRGITRPQGAACDIGAVERRALDQVFSLF